MFQKLNQIKNLSIAKNIAFILLTSFQLLYMHSNIILCFHQNKFLPPCVDEVIAKNVELNRKETRKAL